MPIIDGIYAPGAAVLSTQAVVADTESGPANTDAANQRFLSAKAGRRVVGFSWKGTTIARQAARLVRGANFNAATNWFGAFESETQRLDAGEQFFGPSGIDCSGGISIDWVAGNFDLSIYYIDVS